MCVFQLFRAKLVSADGDDGYYGGDSGVALSDKLKEIFTTNSAVFRITSSGEVEGVSKKITCVVNRNSGKILYWYER